jgi:two-component system heavy metal sensor histidine kinase CusS
VPVALIISLVAGYFLSGFLLKPISHIIVKANSTSLQNEIKLLDEPSAKDELHQLTVALNRMLQRIQKQSHQQNAFFASASHELRTPLSNMLTELQVLEASDIPADMKIILQNQLSEVRRLSRLVNDFLLMSQLRSTGVSVNSEWNNIVEICLESIERLQDKARQQSQAFKMNLLPADAEFRIMTDKNHLSVIIHNLLDNAIKYGQLSSAIHINISRSDENISFQVVNKTDNEIENAEAFKSEFHRQGFYKEGFGLGLWIVNQLVRRNNGRLTLSFKAPCFFAEFTFPVTGFE